MHINNGILHEYSYSNFPLSVWEGAYRAAGDNASKRDSLSLFSDSHESFTEM